MSINVGISVLKVWLGIGTSYDTSPPSLEVVCTLLVGWQCIFISVLLLLRILAYFINTVLAISEWIEGNLDRFFRININLSIGAIR